MIGPFSKVKGRMYFERAATWSLNGRAGLNTLWLSWELYGTISASDMDSEESRKGSCLLSSVMCPKGEVA
jgi:hypothetical protein